MLRWLKKKEKLEGSKGNRTPQLLVSRGKEKREWGKGDSILDTDLTLMKKKNGTEENRTCDLWGEGGEN